MASLEEVISSKDPDVIKKKRSTIQGSMTRIRNHMGKLLTKSAGKFDHDKIKRLNVQENHTDLRKNLESFKVIHEAYQDYREVGEDETQEEALVEKEDQHYEEVFDNVYETLQLVADDEEIYEAIYDKEIYEAIYMQLPVDDNDATLEEGQDKWGNVCFLYYFCNFDNNLSS